MSLSVFQILQETFEKNGASNFWRHFDAYCNVALLCKVSLNSLQHYSILIN